jgi:xylulokinase
MGSGSAEYPIRQPQPERAEQDPQAWWQAACAAVHAALAHVATPHVAAIGLSGQMHGTVLLDAQDRSLAPAVIWPDRRSAAQVAEITQRVGAARLIELAGSPVATGFQAATLLWFQQEQPELWRQVRRVLLPKDALRLRMTGAVATDPSDGSGSLLLDVNRRTWCAELLDALEIDAGMLPPVQPSTSVAGALTPEAAGAFGLTAGTPVVIGAADTACSLLGAGVLEAGDLMLTLSTGGQLVQPATVPGVDRAGRIHTFCSAQEPGQGRAGWYQMGATLAAGLSLRWLRDAVLGISGPDAYERMLAWAGETPPGAGGLAFLPYLVGERTPHMDPHARGVFFGLALEHGRGELVRAVVEGVTLACADAFAVLAELGAAPRRIVLAGGGARSSLWRQIVADVFGLPVTPLLTVEQSALGAALLAGAGIGQLSLVDSARRWAAYGEAFMPDPAQHAQYAEMLGRYRALYARNRDLYPR